MIAKQNGHKVMQNKAKTNTELPQTMIHLNNKFTPLSITKGIHPYIMQNRVMVLIQCTSPHKNLSTNEV